MKRLGDVGAGLTSGHGKLIAIVVPLLYVPGFSSCIYSLYICNLGLMSRTETLEEPYNEDSFEYTAFISFTSLCSSLPGGGKVIEPFKASTIFLHVDRPRPTPEVLVCDV